MRLNQEASVGVHVIVSKKEKSPFLAVHTKISSNQNKASTVFKAHGFQGSEQHLNNLPSSLLISVGAH